MPEDPAALPLGLYDGARLAGQVVLYRAAGVVGLSNLVAADERGRGAVWASAVAGAVAWWPGPAIAGYERGDDLEQARANGFASIGPLRAWLRP